MLLKCFIKKVAMQITEKDIFGAEGLGPAIFFLIAMGSLDLGSVDWYTMQELLKLTV